jgi:hypothetical protein
MELLLELWGWDVSGETMKAILRIASKSNPG